MWKKSAFVSLFAMLAWTPLVSKAECADFWDLAAYVKEDGELDLKRLQRDYARKRTRPITPKVNLPSGPGASSDRIAVELPTPPPPTTSVKFLLRKDFQDVRLFSDILSNADAEGAEFSLTRDKIANDTTWSADALVAIAYNYTVEDIHSTFMGFAVAPYIKLTRELHSNNIDDNVDTKTFGLSGEIGLRNRLFGGSDHFRVRLAAIQDEVKDSTIAHTTGEWIPYYLSKYGTIPGTFVNYNFIPELKAQYDSVTQSGKTILFSGRQDSFRVGPEATLRFKMVTPDGFFMYDFLKRFTGTVTYHWWTELYSGNENNWLDTALTYNIDEEGHIGLKFSYKRGRQEETGAQTRADSGHVRA